MTESNKQNLEPQSWNIANEPRGKMVADEFRDYILGFIFYKYLSEKLRHFADRILTQDGIKYKDINKGTASKLYLSKFYIILIIDMLLIFNNLVIEL